MSNEGMLTAAAPGGAVITAECEGVTDSIEVTVLAADWVTVVGLVDSGAADRAPSADEARSHGRAAEAKQDSGEIPGQPVPVAVDRKPRRRRWLYWVAPAVLAAGLGGAWLLLGRTIESPAASVPIEPVVPQPPAVQRLEFSMGDGQAVSDPLPMQVGDSATLAVVARAADSSVVSDANVGWATTDESIARVNSSGTVYARAAGTLFVIAQVDQLTDSVYVTVAEKPDRRAVPDPVSSRPEPVAERPAPERRAPVEAPPAANGFLKLNIGAYSRVFVDKELEGEELLGLIKQLTPGRHELKIQNERMRPPLDTTVSFNITPNDTTRLSVRQRTQ